jgi:hypothetical protein
MTEFTLRSDDPHASVIVYLYGLLKCHEDRNVTPRAMAAGDAARLMANEYMAANPGVLPPGLEAVGLALIDAAHIHGYCIEIVDHKVTILHGAEGQDDTLPASSALH